MQAYPVDLLEVEDLVLVDGVLHEERGDYDVGGSLVEVFHLPLLYVEGAVLRGWLLTR
jgi:hypothetical protein